MMGRTLVSMRALLLLIPLLAGCAHRQALQVAPVSFRSPGIERCLQYWTANFSRQATNCFYVYPTDLDQGNLVGALKGAESQAWRLRPKVDRTAVLTDESIKGSNDLVAHRIWVNLVRRCITSGKEYVVPLRAAKASYPKPG
jgi:hypothetical protein